MSGFGDSWQRWPRGDVERYPLLKKQMAEMLAAREAVKISTLMVTHNMKSALQSGTRTIMMNEGQIILDISGEERASLTVDDLIERFAQKKGQEIDNDRMLLG
jgi:ABC-type uncharacterized transport system ATPase component